MLKVALIWHSASNDNLGVGALTVSEIEVLRRVGDMRGLGVFITVIDSISDRPLYVNGDDVEVRPTRPLRRPWDYFRLLRSSDLVIDIGGGDSFSDIYGRRRLAQMFFMKFLVHLSGRPLVLAPQTYGPFTNLVSRFLARQTIRRSALVAARDVTSLELVKGMGSGFSIIDSSDVALRLPYKAPIDRSEGGPLKIGINVSGLLMSGGYTRDNMFGLSIDYPQMMREVISRFLRSNLPCDVYLVPHVISWEKGALEDDFAASCKLSEEFPNVVVPPAFASPSEAKSYIAGMDFFIGARMHACIAAFSSGVPVVPMAYSRKFAGLFGSLGYHETVDCTSLNSEEIISRIFDAFERRNELADLQAVAFERGLEKLQKYEFALGQLMEEISASIAV